MINSQVLRLVYFRIVLEAGIVGHVQRREVKRFGLVYLLDLVDRFTDNGMEGA